MRKLKFDIHMTLVYGLFYTVITCSSVFNIVKMMHSLIVALLVLLLRNTQAQDANCDFFQNVQAGQQYYVYSPGYSRNYTPGVQCRWSARCPAGYNCRLDCVDITLPQSQSCSLDRLLISRSGDPQLTSAEYYCGKGSLVVVSTGQSITVGLITSRSSPGGRFYCELSAQPVAPANTCTCGYKKLNRIVGGEPTKVNEYPMMAGLVDTAERVIKCGAVIIGQRYVLTAAHCVFNKSINSVAVVVGEHDVTTGSDTSAMRIYIVERFIIHSQYRQFVYDYDIALVKVTTAIQFSESVGPVCLPFKFANTNLDGAKVTVLGWGTQSFGGPTSKVLRKVDVDVISQQSCSSRVTQTTVTSRQICTYTPGKDSCQDDSGGPLLLTDPATGLLHVVGAVSFGLSCASTTPAVNTRTTAFLEWIVNNAPAEYCVK